MKSAITSQRDVSQNTAVTAVNVLVEGPIDQHDACVANLTATIIAVEQMHSGCSVQATVTILNAGSVLEQGIDVLEGVSQTAKGHLRRHLQVHTIGDLLAHTSKTLYLPHRIGKSSIADIERALYLQFGLKFRKE